MTDKAPLIPANSTGMHALSPAVIEAAQELGYESLELTYGEQGMLYDMLSCVASDMPDVGSHYDEDAGVFVTEHAEPDLHTRCLRIIAANTARRLIEDLRRVHVPSLFNGFEALSEAEAIDLLRRGAPCIDVRLADRVMGYALRSDVAFMLGQMHLLAYPVDLEGHMVRSLTDMHAIEGGPRLSEDEARVELAERLGGVPFETVRRTLVEKLAEFDRTRQRHAPRVRNA